MLIHHQFQLDCKEKVYLHLAGVNFRLFLPPLLFLTTFLPFSAKELAENSHVQDAFVIAVEQQAKERLERLSALRKIKPVDMTKLSQQVGTFSLYSRSTVQNVT